MSRSCRAGLSLLLLLAHSSVASAWVANGALLCGAAGDQRAPAAIADGAGGAIVVWEDRRDGAADVYAQRIAANGSALWTADGVPVAAASGDQITPVIVADGAGGAIVVWEDLRSGGSDVYAQRIDALGAVRWTADGVALCAASGVQTSVVAVSDGAGGAIVAWSDSRGATADVYAQRVDAAGAARWTANGVALLIAPGEQVNPALATDGAGGAIAVWSDGVVHAQRIDAQGTLPWGLGLPVVTASGFQFSPGVVPDGAGGAIVAWTDMRSIVDQDIWAQRLDAAGAVQWGDSGKVVCGSAGYQFGPVALADGAGGAVVVWRDLRGASTDLYAQRVSAAGAAQWTAAGVALCGADGDQLSPSLVANAGGAVVVWHDLRGPQSDIYAAAVTAGGLLDWTDDGAMVCAAQGDQQSAAIVPDGAGGTIVVWDDGRSGTGSDLFAARVTGDGVLVAVRLALVHAAAAPGRVRLEWHAPGPAGLEARLERRAPLTEWTPIADLALDASGRFVFEDRSVAAGQRYGYRLAVREGAQVTHSQAVWIDVPADLRLALEGARPHPVARECVVAIALPSAAPARLEMFDVRGARVLERDLGAPGAGRHLVRLDEAARLANGVYLLRLAQDAASVATKVLVRR